MATKIANAIWDRHIQDPMDKLLMLAIADGANHEGEGTFTVSALGSMCSVSTKKITRRINKMLERGWLESISETDIAADKKKGIVALKLVSDVGKDDGRANGNGAGAFSEPCVQSVVGLPKKLGERFVEEWNAIAKKAGIPGVVSISNGTRKLAICARRKDEFWVENWQEAMDRIPKSPFLCGENDRGWKANVDWFLREGTVQKLMEGMYMGGSKSPRFFASAEGQDGKFADLDLHLERLFMLIGG